MAVSRLSLAVLVLALLPFHEVEACSCAPITFEAAFDAADVIFSRVVESTFTEGGIIDFARHAFFDVLEIWKGELDTRGFVCGVWSTPTCKKLRLCTGCS